jgi:hypothetical protein
LAEAAHLVRFHRFGFHCDRLGRRRGGYWDYPVSLAELVIWGVVYWAASSALDYRARRLGLSGWVRCLANFLVLSLVTGVIYLRFLGWFDAYVLWSG